MRDAFGGTFLMYLIIIFVVIFITFMSETLKYVQAYRTKNVIINYIEEYEGFNQNVIDKLEGTDSTKGYLAQASYNAKNVVKANENIPVESGQAYCSSNYGYCVQMKYKDNVQAYYKVTTYISLDFTQILFMNEPLSISVSGETRFVTLDGNS